MKLSAVFSMLFLLFFSTHAQAQSASPERSGYYQELKLAVDAPNQFVTGYYKNGSDFGTSEDAPIFTCVFYLYGKKTGDKYAIQVWRPKDNESLLIAGELDFPPPKKDKSKPEVRLKLSRMPDGCWDVNPDLTKPEGSRLSLEKAGNWTEVRMVKATKAPFYENPDPNAARKSYMIRGDVFETVQKQSGWVLADFMTKEKGWVREQDLFPITPPN